MPNLSPTPPLLEWRVCLNKLFLFEQNFSAEQHFLKKCWQLFLSMYILYCVPIYSFVTPSFPMNVNSNINLLLANYLTTRVSIPKDRDRMRKSATRLVLQIWLPCESNFRDHPCRLGSPTCGRQISLTL